MRIPALLFLTLSFLFSGAQSQYRYSVDLTRVIDDKVEVKLVPPPLAGNEVEFCFPAMVPGTYSVYNFGRFISDLSVTGKDGQKIPFEKLDANCYKISNASNIDYITYKAEDSWDTNDTGSIVFEPAGTRFDEKQFFILNNHGVFGYFRGMTKVPIDIEIVKPDGFYASTGLSNVEFGQLKDVFHVPGYHELVDAPIMYNSPDTAIVDVGGTKVLVSVMSPNKKVSSAFVARTISSLLMAQKNYLGGKLPVEKYAFLFCFVDAPTLSGSTGALELSYSSMYVLFESDSLGVEQMVKDVSAHEFFHIVTPLNIHSEEIGNFDFNNPVMSRHLWLYEGMTEYAAHHVQVKEGLITVDQFFQTMQDKMLDAQDNYIDTLPFTRMSKGALDVYKEQYNNVYEKGALIGMCMDILLRYYSKGKYGTQDLMMDLSKQYGKSNSFRDEELFATIEKLTYPEIRIFLDNYVAGNQPLPYKDVFKKAGLYYAEKVESEEITLGGIDIGYNPLTEKILVASTIELNEFGKKMGFREGDEILTFNGTKVDLTNVTELFINFLQNAKVGDKLTVEVMRKKKSGKSKKKILKGTVIKTKVIYRNHIELDPNASSREILTRNSWLGLNGR